MFPWIHQGPFIDIFRSQQYFYIGQFPKCIQAKSRLVKARFRCSREEVCLIAYACLKRTASITESAPFGVSHISALNKLLLLYFMEAKCVWDFCQAYRYQVFVEGTEVLYIQLQLHH